MSVTQKAPNTILLVGDEDDVIADLATGASVTPGMLVEMLASGAANVWRPHSAAADQASMFVALNDPASNRGISSVYPSGELIPVHALEAGDVFYGIIPSGQNIANGDKLQSNGDGKLKEATASTATANVYRYQSLDNIGSITVDTRCRVQVI